MILNINSASKTDGTDTKRNEQVRRLPVRMHELLGIPKSAGKSSISKSAGKSRNVDGKVIEKSLPQPVRIKDLFGSASCKKKTSAHPARRMTTVTNVTNNARRQLYNDNPGEGTCSRSIATAISTDSCTVNKTFLEINSGVKCQKRPESVALLGLSRSVGKINKTSDLGRERLKPERMKDYMKSWEKSQTVQPPVRKFTTAQILTTNARRKLYSILMPSPATTSNISQKSVAPNKFQTEKNGISNTKSVKLHAARKSCLLPPNSIRNKYVNLQQNETIKKESVFSIGNKESRKNDDMNIEIDEKMNLNENDRLNMPTTLESNDHESQSDNCESENSKEKSARSEKSANNQTDNFENSTLFENPKETIVAKEDFEKSLKTIDEKLHKIDDGMEIQRPSVIMGISAKGMRNELSSLSSDIVKSCYEISRPPLRELSRHSALLQPRLDEKTTSLEDLLGNSHHECGESFYRENLPSNSFFENTENAQKSFINMDKQTLTWMHGNLKLAVKSTEENLFSMKLVLQAMEDIMKNYNNSETEERCVKMENLNIPPSTISIVDTNENNVEESKIYQENNADRQISNNLLEIPSVNEELVFTDSENVNENRILGNPDEADKENVFTWKDEKIGNNDEKPRRRSLRIAAKMIKSPKRLDDSFSRIEEELNITHVKTKNETPRAAKFGKRLDPRSRRSVREYMALKSSMNFLDTPDVKGMPTPKGEKDTPSHRRATRRSLSRRILTELDDLYAESPL